MSMAEEERSADLLVWADSCVHKPRCLCMHCCLLLVNLWCCFGHDARVDQTILLYYYRRRGHFQDDLNNHEGAGGGEPGGAAAAEDD